LAIRSYSHHWCRDSILKSAFVILNSFPLTFIIALQVRRWDVASGVNTDTYNGSKVVSSIASSSGSPDVVAFGGSDKALRVWDSRSRKGEGLAVQVSRPLARCIC
jgi:WD40 repeat protein